MDGAVPAARHLVERAKRQPAAGQAAVDGFDSERHDAARTTVARFKTSDAVAKRGDGGIGWDSHTLQKDEESHMFPFCSAFDGEESSAAMSSGRIGFLSQPA